MNDSEEFYLPIATSTVCRKPKPEDWRPDNQNVTFQQGSLNNLTLIDSPDNNKENVNINQAPRVSEPCNMGDSTMNLGKYLIPSYPAEMEEDSFIYHELQANKNDSSLPEELVKDFQNWKLDSNGNSSLNDGNKSEENFEKIHESSREVKSDTPIPNFIITDKHILRRHSSYVDKHQNEHLDETVRSSRKILSAPPSIYLSSGVSVPANIDKLIDSVIDSRYLNDPNDETHTQVKDTNLLDDELSSEDENLLDDSFDKYFDEAPNTSQDFVPKSLAEELMESGHEKRRKSAGSLNTIKYIDPDKSMTTETLDNSGQSDTSSSTIQDKSATSDRSKNLNLSDDVDVFPDEGDEDSSDDNLADISNKLDSSGYVADRKCYDEDIRNEFYETQDNEAIFSEKGTSEHATDLSYEQEQNDADIPMFEDDNEIHAIIPLNEENNEFRADTFFGSDANIADISSGEQVNQQMFTEGKIFHEDNIKKYKDDASVVEERRIEHKFEHNWEHPSFNVTVNPLKNNVTALRNIDQDAQTYKKIIFPPSHTVETPCPVGMSHKIVLKIQNQTDLWLGCQISFDNEGKENGFTCPRKLIISPVGVEEVQVWLCPKRKGLCMGNLTVDIDSVISGMLPHQQHSCKITAIGEIPLISFVPDQCIPFGIQYDTSQASFEIKNASKYSLPLKVVLDTEGVDDAFSLCDPVTKDPSSLIRLVLQPHQTYFGHVEFCPYEIYKECKGMLRVYVDSPSGMLLKECLVSGTVAVYKVHCKNNIVLHSCPGVPFTQQVPFRNTGNMVTSVKLSVDPPFEVSPTFLPSLVPGEDAICEISYFPAIPERVTGFLNLALGDSGVVFQVPIEARADKSVKPPGSIVSQPASDSLLQANKSTINFGGNSIGKQREETLLLKNDSQTQMMCLVLSVASQCQSFYIFNGSDISLCCDMILPAGASQSVTLGYTPLHVQQHSGELWIRSKDSSASFCIPLSGHGGVSQVSVLDAQQSSAQLWVEMGDIEENCRNTKRITLHNTGPRAAFVSGALETSQGYPLPPSLGWINPQSFVIAEKSSRDMFIIFEPTERDMNFQNRVASLKLYSGDEIARRRLCKVVRKYEGGGCASLDLAFDPTCEFVTPGDLQIERVKMPAITKGDVEAEKQLFVRGLYQLFISILGQPRRRKSLAPIQDKVIGMRPSVFPIHPQVSEKSTYLKKVETKHVPKWGVNVQSIEMRKLVATFSIINCSQNSLVFDISCEPHLYNITPTTGTVLADSTSLIQIRTLTTKHFISTILVSAGGQDKAIKLTYTPEIPSSVYSPHIPEKSVIFDTIPMNLSKNGFYEFKNTHDHRLRWKLCSVAPAYVQVGDEEPKRVRYSVFCISIVSGVTPSNSYEKIPITFYPKSVGHFTQCWTFSYNVMSTDSVTSQITHNRRVILEGRATDRTVSSRPSPKPSPCSCPKSKNKVFLKTEKIEFYCKPKEQQSVSFKLGNPLKAGSNVKLGALTPPFYLKYSEVLVEAGHSARIPIRFKPSGAGTFSQALKITTEHDVLYLPVLGVSEK